MCFKKQMHCRNYTCFLLIFRPGSLLTTFDLTSRGYYDEPVLRQTIEKPLNDGRVGQYRASPVGFAFRSFSGKHALVLFRRDIL